MKYLAPADTDNLSSIMAHVTAWGVRFVGAVLTEKGYMLEFEPALDPEQLEHLQLTEA